jgi:biopolymer transport protein ExbD
MKSRTIHGYLKVMGVLCVLGIAGLVAGCCATTDPALTKDVAGLKEEVRALRAEVQELKKATVLTEPRPIQLPKAATAAPTAVDLVISVLADGKLMLGGEAVSKDSLKEKLTKLAAEKPEAFVVVQADEKIKHQLVVEVMDLAKSAGIKNLAIAAKEK